MYSGGWRETDDWHVVVDPGAYDPLLGDSFTNIARAGLSLQRSQTAGRFVRTFGTDAAVLPACEMRPARVKSISSMVSRPPSMPSIGCSSARNRPVRRHVCGALWRKPRPRGTRFNLPIRRPRHRRSPAGSRRPRAALSDTTDEEVAFLLRVKERQFEAALTAALGLELGAVAEPPGTKPPTGPYAAFAPPPTLAAVTGGASIDVAVNFVNHASADVALEDVALEGAAGRQRGPLVGAESARHRAIEGRLTIAIPSEAAVTRPYFSRRGLSETRYTCRPGSRPGGPWAAPALWVAARYRFDGVTATLSAPVMRREAVLPDGYASYELEVLPPASLTVSPAVTVVRMDDIARPTRVNVDLTSFAAEPVAGAVRVQAPAGWTVTPASAEVTLRAAGDRQRSPFTVTAPPGADAAALQAVFTTGGREWRLDYTALRHRDLPVRYFVRDATSLVTVVDLQVDRGVRVGYVMGIGDEVPAALEQLGARVTAITADDLATGDLTRFDTIVTGTRAYAVRDDLRMHNRRLLDWVNGGGNLVVLYNTPEFDPRRFAPYAATLPQDAEEVSEEDAPVTVLAPQHPLLSTPNRITAADFDGWIEQRGSKFLSTWDDRFVPLAESHDRGQAPQRGGWLTTSFGQRSLDVHGVRTAPSGSVRCGRRISHTGQSDCTTMRAVLDC